MYMNYKIYTSTDNGDSWSVCMTGIAQNNLYSLKFLQSPSADFYVHIDNSDWKLYRYMPASNSWSLVSLPFDTYEVDGIDIDLQGRMWVCADASYSVMHYSDDGGQTFQQVTTIGQMLG